ncbi:MAG: hypothetical protein OXM55_02925 [Bdellovibrionales bacterium]|nr:hypothetical protein [Bdellovibrionales bacterium]
MKILLQNRVWVALILSCSLALLFISNCTPERGSKGNTDNTKIDDNNGVSTGSDSALLSCDLIEKCSGKTCQCSGSDCCKEDKDCQDKCTKSFSDDGLRLRNKTAKNTCFHLQKEMVDRLFELIEDLDKPKVERLGEIGQDEDDMNLICSAVKELDYDLLDERIDGYSPTEAKRVLGWVTESLEALEIFENAEDDKGVPMFQKLLQKASGASNDQGILAGLTVDVAIEDDSDDEKKHVMRWALENNNEALVRWIHNEIIADHDESLCGDKNKSNWPTNGDADAERAAKFEEEYGEKACILGVYCNMAPSNKEDDNKFRQEMAELIDSEVEVSDFIKEEIVNGGLGLSEEVAEDWKREACCKLNPNSGALWSNGTSLGVLAYDSTGCDGN